MPSDNTAAQLATLNSSPKTTYNRGQALSIRDLSLVHDGGRILFQSSDLALKHGSITGLVGTNGAGKTSLARILSSGQQLLPHFPQSLAIEYLAASDDEEYLAGSTAKTTSSSDASMEGSPARDLKPVEYIEMRINQRSDGLRTDIEELETKLENGCENSNNEEEDIQNIADQLSDLYDMEQALAEKVKREMDHALTELGLAKHAHKSLSVLSSGWRYKCRLVAAFLTHPDLLIIDEPSFLDDVSTKWFITRTKEAAKTDNAIVMLISHKELLLDTLCDEILYINSANQTLTTFHCGYETFRSTREEQVQHSTKAVEGSEKKHSDADKSLKSLKSKLKSREKNLKAKTTQNADQRFIKGKNKEAKQKADRSAASKLRRTKAKVHEMEEVKRLARTERVKALHIEGLPAAGGPVVTLNDVAVGYVDDGGVGSVTEQEGLIFENVDACIESNDRILLKGANGCGKSTLIQAILGKIEATRGSIARTGNFIYFPQTALRDLIRISGRQTALEFLGGEMTETQARNHLGDFGLARDLALRPIATLSAGQRVRLWLAKEQLIHPKPSLLVVDEISENVDIQTRDSLVDLLSTFGAAVLCVSHDPDFCAFFKPTKTWELMRYGMRESYTE